ncbi:hypothetical protein [Pseudomonas fluorescens]|uniref:Uncharacterized protein n=1 Tax=Pseudomonas fluorescens TaxID=294 RepID=A0A5E7E5Z1_PSEFL|nr:hypothetical protein [Pseudomonas fluorescens]VVO22121.1 hypothetical protein PS723_04295 [Pseudomonas fluorescens]
MSEQRLANTNPVDYRFAVHCCGYKLDLTDKPDRAVGLFEHRAVAQQFGRLMWPSTFEVIDIVTGEKV